MVFEKSRIHYIHMCSRGAGTRPYFPVCASLWAEVYGHLHRNLFSHGVSHGQYICSIFTRFHLQLKVPCIHFICLSLDFSLVVIQVMGVKAVGIALKLSFEGKNQFKYFQTWLFTVFVTIFCLLQLNYLNKVFVGFPLSAN